MTDDIAISVENVTKAYRIWRDPAARLKAPLLNAVGALIPERLRPSMLQGRLGHNSNSRYCRDFYALRNVSFEVKKGEAVGIIGRNGSGKSTLLQMIAGTLMPTHGSVKTYGKVAALLELGSGFNPDFTGRENVYMNASVLGLTRNQVDERYREILDFAEIGDFIEQPVKTYSSGMMMRLAFAVQVAVVPDVLIVDESLSVGDVFFSQKCFERIRAMKRMGMSLLFVSHDTSAVQGLCSRSILLHGGEVVFDGLPQHASSRYYSLQAGASGGALAGRPPSGGQVRKLSNSDYLNVTPSRDASRLESPLIIKTIRVRNHHGLASLSAQQCEPFCIEVELAAFAYVDSPQIGIHIYDRMNTLVFAAGSPQLRIHPPAVRGGDALYIDMRIWLNLSPGEYTFSINCAVSSAVGPDLGVDLDRIEGLGPINVYSELEGAQRFYGVAQLPMEMVYRS